jgi:hypothetical protein
VRASVRARASSRETDRPSPIESGGNRMTVVHELDRHVVCGLPRSDSDSAAGVLHGVVAQVADDLVNAQRVGFASS